MTRCSSLQDNTTPLDLQMADVHLFSVDNIVRGLSNSMTSIASSISPSSTPHDTSYILNSIPEYLCDADPGVWQQFVPHPHITFSSPLPSLYPATAITLPQTGYDSNYEMAEGAMMRELIGRLGRGEFSNGVASLASNSPQYSFKFGEEDGWRGLDASNNIAFSLDLPKQNSSLQEASLAASPSCLAGITSDPGVAQLPQNFSSLCNGGSSQLGQHSIETPNKSEAMTTGKKHIKASSSPSTATESGGRAMQPIYQSEEDCQCRGSPERSCNSCHDPVQNPSKSMMAATTGRKRKAAEDKIMDVPSTTTRDAQKIVKKQKTEDMKIKGQKSSESIKEAEETNKKAEPHSSGNSADSGHMHAKESPKLPEPPKQDYIHVRARRGQATDSHSLAERVRREKISERMKFLQDLVPGCNKISGKAVMLDEIINYVQSLQRQVEVLSMKLAALNTRPDINLDSIFSKEVLQGQISPSPFGFHHELISNFSLLSSAQAKMNRLGDRCTGGLDSRPLSRSSVLNSNIFRDANSQTSSLWDDEVQNAMQIGFELDQIRVQHPKTEL
ncbi:hypothetical protein O6H91_10G044000 [Diphasiastrum complanatum]|uniref:Uncharacterized protein n=1 Tax=Diphasiastrum complanatum TaxID=34168 RepID=A0ACC2CGF2_DIPCM|nr:hypothetical protein O6H91_10G044000 [Diphasiastrum complanatum]